VVITQLFLRPKTAPVTVLEVAAPSPSPTPSASPLPQEIRVEHEKNVLGESIPKHLTVPPGSSVNIRSKPSVTGPVIMTLKTSIDVLVLETKADWSRIGFNEAQAQESWWVNSQFLD
jgi:hypothetical protein